MAAAVVAAATEAACNLKRAIAKVQSGASAHLGPHRTKRYAAPDHIEEISRLPAGRRAVQQRKTDMSIEFAVTIMVLTAAATDLGQRRIPNVVVGLGIVVALLMHLFLVSDGWSPWFMGMLTGFALFLPLYLLRGMAAGDVKLLAAVGSFVGPAETAVIALTTFLIGGLWALAVVVINGKARHALVNMRTLLAPFLMRAIGIPAQPVDLQQESVGRLPYGVAIAIGTISVAVLDLA